MKKIKIIVDDGIPFINDVLEEYADITYLSPAKITKLNVKDADALIIRTRTRCNENLLKDSTVKFIATASVGYDHIDTIYCERNGIKWASAPGSNSSSVNQYFAAALLKIAEKYKLNLSNMTIGIVGVGNVGSKIEKFCRNLGMNTLLNDPPREKNEGNAIFTPLDNLIERSDVITLHVPLNLYRVDKTYHLADKIFFEKFKSSKVLINTSRGEVVETYALKQAIKNEKVSACILDVWENEPYIDTELLNIVDVATPHIAGYSVEGKANGTAACVNSLNDFFNLGLESNWYPNYLPFPEGSNEIEVNCLGKSKQQIISECVYKTYNILEDDQRLRNSTNDFEKQRVEYPARRELNYYKIKILNGDVFIYSVLSELGFNVTKN